MPETPDLEDVEQDSPTDTGTEPDSGRLSINLNWKIIGLVLTLLLLSIWLFRRGKQADTVEDAREREFEAEDQTSTPDDDEEDEEDGEDGEEIVVPEEATTTERSEEVMEQIGEFGS